MWPSSRSYWHRPLSLCHTSSLILAGICLLRFEKEREGDCQGSPSLSFTSPFFISGFTLGAQGETFFCDGFSRLAILRSGSYFSKPNSTSFLKRLSNLRS